MTVDPAAFLQAAGTLPFHGGGSVESSAPPGHPFFGALLLFIGSILVVELLAGPVWRRHRALVMLWPLALLIVGLGLLLVTDMQETEKSLHVTLAVLFLAGSYTEFQYRCGRITRYAADAFAVPALIVGGFVIGPMHPNGPILYSAMAQLHMLVATVCWVLAVIKLAEARLLNAPAASLSFKSGLDYSFGVGVMALGFSLLLVQQFHGGH